MISGWLGQNSTSGAGVLTVTGWNLSGTPTNVVVDPATLQKVLLAGNDATMQGIVGLASLTAAIATTFNIVSQKDLILTDAALSQIAMDGLGDIQFSALNIFEVIGLLWEVQDALGNVWSQVDASIGLVSLGDLSGSGNSSYLSIDDNAKTIVQGLQHIIATLNSTLKTFDISGVNPAFSVNGTPGININQPVVVDLLGTIKTLQFEGGILVGIV